MSERRVRRRLIEVVFVAVVEALLYLRYRSGDGTFHYFTHLFAGASLALVLMTAVARRRHRPVGLPLLAMLAGHLFAMTPDLLYVDDVAHARWMDIFVAHNISHFIPGRNVTWYLLFLIALALYLAAAPPPQRTGPRRRQVSSPGALPASLT